MSSVRIAEKKSSSNAGAIVVDAAKSFCFFFDSFSFVCHSDCTGAGVTVMSVAAGIQSAVCGGATSGTIAMLQAAATQVLLVRRLDCRHIQSRYK